MVCIRSSVGCRTASARRDLRPGYQVQIQPSGPTAQPHQPLTAYSLTLASNRTAPYRERHCRTMLRGRSPLSRQASQVTRYDEEGPRCCVKYGLQPSYCCIQTRGRCPQGRLESETNISMPELTAMAMLSVPTSGADTTAGKCSGMMMVAIPRSISRQAMTRTRWMPLVRGQDCCCKAHAVDPIWVCRAISMAASLLIVPTTLSSGSVTVMVVVSPPVVSNMSSIDEAGWHSEGTAAARDAGFDITKF